jgi:nucleotide-binding universal stress UspA family protein
MSHKILCAVDDVEHSRIAVIQAAELAAKLHAPLIICSVNGLAGGMRGPPIYLHEESEIKKLLDFSAALARSYGAKTVTEVELKARLVASSIIQYAEEQGVTQIVVGTEDKRGLVRLVLGSVAGEIAARAHCSVTIAR